MATMINRRRMMGKKGLPYDAEVEYLQSSGQQLIVCDDYSLTANKVTYKFNLRVLSPGGVAFGYRGYNDYETPLIYCFYDSDNSGRRMSVFGTTRATLIPAYPGQTVSGALDIYRNPKQVILGSIKVQYSGDALQGNTGLFGAAVHNPTTNTFELKDGISMILFSGFQILHDDVLFRDYLTVRIGSVGYLYDKVSGNLFGDICGTEPFIVGADKN